MPARRKWSDKDAMNVSATVDLSRFAVFWGLFDQDAITEFAVADFLYFCALLSLFCNRFGFPLSLKIPCHTNQCGDCPASFGCDPDRPVADLDHLVLFYKDAYDSVPEVVERDADQFLPIGARLVCMV